MSLQSPTRASRSRCQSQLPLLCGSTVPLQLLLRDLRHPFSTLPSSSCPWHAAPLISSLINRTAHRPMLHQPHQLPPHKKGVKCMTTKEGFSQISSLSYLPQKATLGQPKMTLLTLRDTSSLSVSLLSYSHPFPFYQLCILTLFPRASAGICLTCQPVSGSYTSREFYSLQKMFSARTAPLNWLLMGRWSVSPSVVLLP